MLSWLVSESEEHSGAFISLTACKGGTGWIKRCVAMEVGGRQRGHQRKTRLDGVMKSLVCLEKIAQVWNKWGKKINGTAD